MQEADGVIFASPGYTANVSGLMKNLMDRLAYTAHRPVPRQARDVDSDRQHGYSGHAESPQPV
jgi:multimeric flavodoxin WrbA